MFVGEGEEEFWLGLDDQINEGDFRSMHVLPYDVLLSTPNTISAGGLTTSHGQRTLTILSTFVRKTMTIMTVSSSQKVAGKYKKISVKTVECLLSARHQV